jgi:hypothetical protein
VARLPPQHDFELLQGMESLISPWSKFLGIVWTEGPSKVHFPVCLVQMLDRFCNIGPLCVSEGEGGFLYSHLMNTTLLLHFE